MDPFPAPAAPVLVFTLDRNPILHGMLGVIRTMGRMGVEVYALVNGNWVPSTASRYLKRSFTWQTERNNADGLAARLATIGTQLGRKAVLIATDDCGAALVAEHAHFLAPWFLFPRLPPGVPRQLSNKRELYALCGRAGVPCPRTVCPSSRRDVHAFAEQAQFPVVVKAAEAQRLPSGVRSTSIAQGAVELLRIYQQAERVDAANLIFQEYIPEGVGEDWVFHGYTNPETGCFVSFTGKKLRSHPAFAGPTTLGVPIPNEALCRQTGQLLREVGYAGIMDLDYRFDRRDGQYKLLDFNPRSGANFRMFENTAGIDVVRALYLDLTGRPVPRTTTMKPRTFIDESHDLAASVKYLRRGRLTVRGWWHSLKGPRELAWFCSDDPLPAVAMCCRLLPRSVARAVRTRIRKAGWRRLARSADGVRLKPSSEPL